MWFHETVNLLRKSEKLYLELGLQPPRLRPIFIQDIFPIGGIWMKRAVRRLGLIAVPKGNPPFQELGYFKYGLALWGAVLVFGLLIPFHLMIALLIGFLSFYALEAQMVFLFPLSIEGVPNPIGESFRHTQRAGGTWKVMSRVIIIAFYMLTGGFLKQNFKKSWCVGCLAVLVWYLHLKEKKAGLHELV